MLSTGSSSHWYILILSASNSSVSCRLSIPIFFTPITPVPLNAKPAAATSALKAQVSGEQSQVLGGGETQVAFPILQ